MGLFNFPQVDSNVNVILALTATNMQWNSSR